MGGITAATGNNLLYGTNGYLSVGAVDLGATEGDFQVEWGAEHYYPDLAQALGPLAGTGKVSNAFFRLKATLAEFGWTNLSAILAELGADSSGSSYKFGGGVLNAPVELQNVTLLGLTRNDNKPVKITLPVCYVEVDSIAFSKAKEATLPVTFIGLYTTTDPKKLPGFIEIGK